MSLITVIGRGHGGTGTVAAGKNDLAERLGELGLDGNAAGCAVGPDVGDERVEGGAVAESGEVLDAGQRGQGGPAGACRGRGNGGGHARRNCAAAAGGGAGRQPPAQRRG